MIGKPVNVGWAECVSREIDSVDRMPPVITVIGQQHIEVV